MGTASLVRTAFTQAQNHAAEAAAAKDDDKQPPPNLKLEALGLALDGKIPVIFAAHRADDLETAPAAGEGVRPEARLDLATEGYLMADAIADGEGAGGGASDDAAGRRRAWRR